MKVRRKFDVGNLIITMYTIYLFLKPYFITLHNYIFIFIFIYFSNIAKLRILKEEERKMIII